MCAHACVSALCMDAGVHRVRALVSVCAHAVTVLAPPHTYLLPVELPGTVFQEIHCYQSRFFRCFQVRLPFWASAYPSEMRLTGGSASEVAKLFLPGTGGWTVRRHPALSLTFSPSLPNRLSQSDLRPGERQPPPLPVCAGAAGEALPKAPGPGGARQLRALAGSVRPELPVGAALLGGAHI